AAPVLLRPGGVALETLAKLLGPIETAADNDPRPRSPGRLQSHYAPELPLRLEATSARPQEALLAFGAEAPGGFAERLFLSRAGGLGRGVVWGGGGRSRGGGGHPFGEAAPPRPPGFGGPRRQADPGEGARPRDHRPAAPRRAPPPPMSREGGDINAAAQPRNA